MHWDGDNSHSSCEKEEILRDRQQLIIRQTITIIKHPSLYDFYVQSTITGSDWNRINLTWSASCVKYILDLPPPAQVHLSMVRYHEAGRFCEKDEQWDQDSAMFHLERAALCGELEAIIALGQCCLQLPHHILPDIELEVPCTV